MPGLQSEGLFYGLGKADRPKHLPCSPCKKQTEHTVTTPQWRFILCCEVNPITCASLGAPLWTMYQFHPGVKKAVQLLLLCAHTIPLNPANSHITTRVSCSVQRFRMTQQSELMFHWRRSAPAVKMARKSIQELYKYQLGEVLCSCCMQGFCFYSHNDMGP